MLIYLGQKGLWQDFDTQLEYIEHNYKSLTWSNRTFGDDIFEAARFLVQIPRPEMAKRCTRILCKRWKGTPFWPRLQELLVTLELVTLF